MCGAVYCVACRCACRGRLAFAGLAPARSEPEALIGLRLKGKRTQYVVALSDVYRWAAQTYAAKESAAKRQARKLGIRWATAKRDFLKGYRIP